MYTYVCMLPPVAQIVKNLPEVQEMRVWSLGGEDTLGEENDYPM